METVINSGDWERVEKVMFRPPGHEVETIVSHTQSTVKITKITRKRQILVDFKWTWVWKQLLVSHPTVTIRIQVFYSSIGKLGTGWTVGWKLMFPRLMKRRVKKLK
jgi:hypothetical protein